MFVGRSRIPAQRGGGGQRVFFRVRVESACSSPGNLPCVRAEDLAGMPRDGPWEPAAGPREPEGLPAMDWARPGLGNGT
jgi:hypothetical protein